MALVFAIGSSILVSLISLAGIVTLILNEKIIDKILIFLLGFSGGAMIGGAFFHLLPEALEKSSGIAAYVYLIIGFITFFILERYLLWRHCHDGKCDVHPFSYLNLIGDGIHNFVDGLAIGASFVANINLGLIMTLVIILHEIPQEIGDFGVLVYGGLNKYKALFYNFLSALTAILGALLGFYFSAHIENFIGLILPFAAGGFIYIASCDLIPELHKQSDNRRATLSIIFFILGALLMLVAKIVRGH